MIKVFNKVFEDVRNGKNIENYIIIVLVLVIFILDTFGISDPSWISNITLSVLALIAFGRIVDAVKLDNIETKISRIDQSRFLREFPTTLIDDMRDTPELWLVGITLSRTVNTHYSLFQKKLEQGGVIKVLLVKPESAATEIAAFRDRRGRLPDSYDRGVKSTLNDFCRLSQTTKGRIEVKTINTAFSFGYYAMEPNTPHGKIYIEHYAFKSEEGDIPKMILSRSDDFVYKAYLDQLNSLWEHASEWNCLKEADVSS